MKEDPEEELGLSEEEAVVLYRLIKNLEKAGWCISEIAGYDCFDDISHKLKMKIIRHVRAKGPEWMRGKGCPYW